MGKPPGVDEIQNLKGEIVRCLAAVLSTRSLHMQAPIKKTARGVLCRCNPRLFPIPAAAVPFPAARCAPASDLFPHPEGEIRRYSFPALAIRCERELLEVQQAEDMKEILSNVSASVDAFASLMELMDAEAKVDGVIIHILGRELQRIGKILFKMQDTYSTVELVGA